MPATAPVFVLHAHVHSSNLRLFSFFACVSFQLLCFFFLYRYFLNTYMNRIWSSRIKTRSDWLWLSLCICHTWIRFFFLRLRFIIVVVAVIFHIVVHQLYLVLYFHACICNTLCFQSYAFCSSCFFSWSIVQLQLIFGLAYTLSRCAQKKNRPASDIRCVRREYTYVSLLFRQQLLFISLNG